MTQCFTPVTLGPLKLKNRIIKAATFEGRCPNGEVTEDLARFHGDIAAGGVGMSTVAYLATSPEGRTHRDQFDWRTGDHRSLVTVTDAIHAHGAAASAQIGHAGPVANAASNNMRALSPSSMFLPQSFGFAKSVSLTDIDRIAEDHVHAAQRAVHAGFDAVELHFGHNYLVSSFLSPRVNKRTDHHGGTLANRSRFALDIARRVTDSVGGRAAVIVKMNLTDGVRGGFSLPDSIAVVKQLQDSVGIDAVEMTAGSSLLNPMYLFKGGVPLEEFAATQPAPLALGLRFAGHKFFKTYPYSPLYLLEDAQAVRAAVSLPMIALGGITDMASIDTALQAGFECVAMGRALVRDPQHVAKLQQDHQLASDCSHCNKCMTTIYSGTHCPEPVG